MVSLHVCRARVPAQGGRAGGRGPGRASPAAPYGLRCPGSVWPRGLWADLLTPHNLSFPSEGTGNRVDPPPWPAPCWASVHTPCTLRANVPEPRGKRCGAGGRASQGRSVRAGAGRLRDEHEGALAGPALPRPSGLPVTPGGSSHLQASPPPPETGLVVTAARLRGRGHELCPGVDASVSASAMTAVDGAHPPSSGLLATEGVRTASAGGGSPSTRGWSPASQGTAGATREGLP